MLHVYGRGGEHSWRERSQDYSCAEKPVSQESPFGIVDSRLCCAHVPSLGESSKLSSLVSAASASARQKNGLSQEILCGNYGVLRVPFLRFPHNVLWRISSVLRGGWRYMFGFPFAFVLNGQCDNADLRPALAPRYCLVGLCVTKQNRLNRLASCNTSEPVADGLCLL